MYSATCLRGFVISLAQAQAEIRRAAAVALEQENVARVQEMQAKCDERGGNAVVGVDLDYEVVGQKGSMLMVTVTGTAVRI